MKMSLAKVIQAMLTENLRSIDLILDNISIFIQNFESLSVFCATF